MSDLLVVGSHFDSLREVYVLTVGVAVEQDVPALDGDGNVLRAPDVTVEHPETGEEVVVPGEPLSETRTVLVPLEEFTFSGVDPKWEDKGPDEIVREQKRIVRKALRERERAAEEQAGERLAMPGVGDPL